jgi:hypothetical protein
MKNLIIAWLCLASLSINGQEVKTEFDGHKWEAPYHLSIPKDWTIERFLIPISFAPQIAYEGVEDIRFTPGWANVKSDEYWTYAFLWYLNGSPKMNAKIIAENLKAYYTGLYRINTDSTKTAPKQSIPVTTLFKKTATNKGDLATYSGTIKMMDYMQQKPIKLNCTVHLKFCKEENKTIVFYKLSPKPLAHSNWLHLNELWSNFTFKKL